MGTFVFHLLTLTAKSSLATEDQFVLDDFLRTLESGGFVLPSEVAIPTADTVPQVLSLSSEHIDWNAPFDTQTCEPTFDSIFGRFHTNSLPLPEIDLSILQLP